MAVIVFLYIVLLQTALIHWQHFSPFERESNLRAVLWGARPAPRYWAVLALDVCTSLLVFVLVFGQAEESRLLGRLLAEGDEDFGEEILGRDLAHEADRVGDHGVGHAVDTVLLDQEGELGGLDHGGADPVAGHGQPVSGPKLIYRW